MVNKKIIILVICMMVLLVGAILIVTADPEARKIRKMEKTFEGCEEDCRADGFTEYKSITKQDGESVCRCY